MAMPSITGWPHDLWRQFQSPFELFFGSHGNWLAIEITMGTPAKQTSERVEINGASFLKFLDSLATLFKRAGDAEKTNLARNALTTLQKRDTMNLTPTEIEHFISFIDAHIRTNPLTLNLLKMTTHVTTAALASFTHAQLVTLLQSVIRHVRISYQPTSVRSPLITLLGEVVKGMQAAPPTEDSIQMAQLCLTMGQGEKEPVALHAFLTTLRAFMIEVDRWGAADEDAAIDIEDVAQDVFDDLALYYPLTYQPAADNPDALPRAALVDAYNAVLFGSPAVVVLSVPFIIDHLSLAKEQDKIACFTDLTYVLTTHGFGPVGTFGRDLWWEIAQEACHGSAPCRTAALQCMIALLNVADDGLYDVISEYVIREIRFDSGNQQLTAGIVELAMGLIESARAAQAAAPVLVALYRRVFYVNAQREEKKTDADYTVWLHAARRITEKIAATGAEDMLPSLTSTAAGLKKPANPRRCDTLHPLTALLAATLPDVRPSRPTSSSDTGYVVVATVGLALTLMGPGAVTGQYIREASKAANMSVDAALVDTSRALLTHLNPPGVAPTLAELTADPITMAAARLIRCLTVAPIAAGVLKSSVDPTTGPAAVLQAFSTCRGDKDTSDVITALLASPTPDVDAIVYGLHQLTGPLAAPAPVLDLIPTLSVPEGLRLALAVRQCVPENVAEALFRKYIKPEDVAGFEAVSAAAQSALPLPTHPSALARLPLLVAMVSPSASLGDVPRLLHGMMVAADAIHAPSVQAAVKAVAPQLAPADAAWLVGVIDVHLQNLLDDTTGHTTTAHAFVRAAATFVDCALDAVGSAGMRPLLTTLVRLIGYGPVDVAEVVASELQSVFAGHPNDGKLFIELAGQLMMLEGQTYSDKARTPVLLQAIAGLATAISPSSLPILCRLNGGDIVFTLLDGVGHHGELEVPAETGALCAAAVARIGRVSPQTLVPVIRAVVEGTVDALTNIDLTDPTLDGYLRAVLDLLRVGADITGTTDKRRDLQRLACHRLKAALNHPRRDMRARARLCRSKWFLVSGM